MVSSVFVCVCVGGVETQNDVTQLYKTQLERTAAKWWIRLRRLKKARLLTSQDITF